MPDTSASQSHEEVLFGDVELDLDLEDNMRTVADDDGLTQQQQAQELREFATLAMHDVGLERHDARLLHEVCTKRRLAADSDEWVAPVGEWAKTSRRRLRERYGTEQAEVLLTQLDAYAAVDPTLQKILEGGVGAHPAILVTVRRARASWSLSLLEVSASSALGVPRCAR